MVMTIWIFSAAHFCAYTLRWILTLRLKLVLLGTQQRRSVVTKKAVVGNDGRSISKTLLGQNKKVPVIARGLPGTLFPYSHSSDMLLAPFVFIVGGLTRQPQPRCGYLPGTCRVSASISPPCAS